MVEKLKSPEFDSGFFSQVFFTWLSYLFQIAQKRPIVQDDLLPINRVDDPQLINNTFSKHYSHFKDEKEDERPVRLSLFAQFTPPMVKAGILKLINSTLQFGPSLLLYYLLQTVQSPSSWPLGGREGYIFATMLFVVSYPCSNGK